MPNNNLEKTDYLLKGMPLEMMLKVKHLAVEERTTIKALILEAVEDLLVERGVVKYGDRNEA